MLGSKSCPNDVFIFYCLQPGKQIAKQVYNPYNPTKNEEVLQKGLHYMLKRSQMCQATYSAACLLPSACQLAMHAKGLPKELIPTRDD